jgi:CRISPR type III-associated protein (TIGR04423 family)
MEGVVMKSRYDKNKILIEDINKLEGYRGYVQFSHRPLELKDVFEDKDPDITETKGFVYEAHFSNGNESIMIRQQNAEWVVSKTDISTVAKEDEEFYALEKTTLLTDVKSNWVKMAQIWESKEDALCDKMNVMKLQKVVFVEFTEFAEKKEKSNDNSTI